MQWIRLTLDDHSRSPRNCYTASSPFPIDNKRSRQRSYSKQKVKWNQHLLHCKEFSDCRHLTSRLQWAVEEGTRDMDDSVISRKAHMTWCSSCTCKSNHAANHNTCSRWQLSRGMQQVAIVTQHAQWAARLPHARVCVVCPLHVTGDSPYRAQAVAWYESGWAMTWWR